MPARGRLVAFSVVILMAVGAVVVAAQLSSSSSHRGARAANPFVSKGDPDAAVKDKAGIANRELIGVDNITWECDYPHSDSSWPHAPEAFAKHFDDTVSDDDVAKISHLNAIKAFRYDPF